MYSFHIGLIVNISSLDFSVDEDNETFMITVFIVNGVPVTEDVEVEIDYIDGRANGKYKMWSLAVYKRGSGLNS